MILPNKLGRKAILDELNKKKFSAIGFIFLNLVSGIIEVVGIGLVFPFIYILISPSAIEKFSFIQSIRGFFDFTRTLPLAVVLVSVIFSLIFIKSIYSLLFKYLQMRILIKQKTKLSLRLMKLYLNLNLSFHRENKPASLVNKMVISSLIFDHYLLPIVRIISALVILLGYMSILFIILPHGALAAIAIFGALLSSIYYFNRNRLVQLGIEANEVGLRRQEVLFSSFYAIQEIKFFGKEDYVANLANKIETSYYTNQQRGNFFSTMPAIILEAGALIGILGLIVFFLHRNEQAHALAVLSVLFASMFRMLPQVTAILNGLQLLNTGVTYVNNIAGDLINYDDNQSHKLNKKVYSKLDFNKKLSFKGVWYKYPDQKKDYALKEIDIEIKPGQFIGITGHSAAGKSTLINLLLCLLEPYKGKITVDEVQLDDKQVIRKWQNNIGYVPQSIYILEDSIISNIAFGVTPEEVNLERVCEVMQLVGLSEFLIEGKDYLCQKFGDNGVKLSGGQRQRIGIARALYHDPSVLVLDESTANLDMQLETTILYNLLQIKPRKTVILVTHRITSLKECDKIFVLSKGKIEEKGKFNKLRESGGQFQNLLDKLELQKEKITDTELV